MKNKNTKGQIELYKLIFTLNWEDPESDYKALKISEGDKVMTITSGGCNTLSFLLFNPAEIHTVDINPSQSYLMELKIAGIKNLNHEEYLKFLGLKHSNTRKQTYNKLKGDLSDEANIFWEQNIDLIKKGLLINGRYEKFVKIVAGLIKIIQGKKRIDGLFINRDMESQQNFYHNYWETKRTRLIFDLFFNRYILAKRGLKSDYFHFDDGSSSFSESFFKRFSKVLKDVPVKGNYFLHLYLKGCYKTLEELPDYLLKQNFDIIKSKIDRIKIFTGDAKKWLAAMPDNYFNCLALSNICELMDTEDTLTFFNEVYRTGMDKARICFRNLMIPREVPEILNDQIIQDKELSKTIFDNDRSFVYGKVAAYTIKK